MTFLYMLNTRLTHNGSESENLNFKEMVASLALFYFLKCKSKTTVIEVSKPCKNQLFTGQFFEYPTYQVCI